MKMVTILMMSAKLATKVPLKIKVFWNIGYDVIFLSIMPLTKFCHLTQITL